MGEHQGATSGPGNRRRRCQARPCSGRTAQVAQGFKREVPARAGRAGGGQATSCSTMGDYPVLQFFTLRPSAGTPGHDACLAPPNWRRDPQWRRRAQPGDGAGAARRLAGSQGRLPGRGSQPRSAVNGEPDPSPSAHLQSGIAPLWLSEQSFHPDDAAVIASPGPGRRQTHGKSRGLRR